MHMKTKYTMFRRGGIYYSQDTATGQQKSLRTRDETEAIRLLHALNEAQRLRWILRQRQTIFRLLLHRFGVLSGKSPLGNHHRPATLRRVTVEYDLNGNLLSDGRRGFEYDDENQLTKVTVTNVWKSEFSHDGKMRRRIRKEYAVLTPRS